MPSPSIDNELKEELENNDKIVSIQTFWEYNNNLIKLSKKEEDNEYYISVFNKKVNISATIMILKVELIKLNVKTKNIKDELDNILLFNANVIYDYITNLIIDIYKCYEDNNIKEGVIDLRNIKKHHLY